LFVVSLCCRDRRRYRHARTDRQTDRNTEMTNPTTRSIVGPCERSCCGRDALERFRQNLLNSTVSPTVEVAEWMLHALRSP
jgi:hypothetical protein